MYVYIISSSGNAVVSPTPPSLPYFVVGELPDSSDFQLPILKGDFDSQTVWWEETPEESNAIMTLEELTIELAKTEELQRILIQGEIK